jgi:RNAse (barnase) inhibitor barstar
MMELVLDGAGWNEPDDLFDAFFRAVGAPSWHGRNFNALVDSIETGQINTLEVPYRIVIRNYELIGSGAKGITADFVSFIEALMARGCPIEIRTQLSTDPLPAPR